MHDINLHLTSRVLISKRLLSEKASLLAPIPTKWTNSQLLALNTWLSNFVFYEGEQILFIKGNIKTTQPRHNPLRIGNKVLVAVLDKLEKAHLVKIISGVPRYTGSEPRKSSVIPDDKILSLADRLGINKESIHEYSSRCHVRMRTVGKGKKGDLSYKDTPYTLYIESMMKDYCRYLNSYEIDLLGHKFKNIHLYRNYQARKGSNSFIYGGRSGGYWMSLPKDSRRLIKINREETTSCDYPFSQTNFLYKEVTGNWLDKADDAYLIPGIDIAYREVIKTWINMMYNVSYQGIKLALRNYYNGDASESWKQKYDALIKQIRVSEVTKMILERHQPIAHLFFLGAIMGQHYAWYEANAIFEVALNACKAGIPCLTVHDEFIIPIGRETAMWDLMYSVCLNETIYKGIDLTTKQYS
jgi:hypothetical protein